MTDQTQRLEVATVKAEIGSDILHRFANDGADAAKIPTNSGDIKNLKQIIVEVENKASFSSGIYPDVASGLAEAAEGGMFLVETPGQDEIYAVFRKVGGVAVDTGKRALSSQRVVDATIEAQQAANDAADSADVAAAAVSVIELSTGIFPTVAAGLAATPADGYFSVPSPSSNEYLILYKNTAGSALEIKRYPSSGAVSVVSDRTSKLEAETVRAEKISDTEFVWTGPTDKNKQVSIGVRKDGTVFAGGISPILDDLDARAIRVTPFEDTSNFVWTGPTDMHGQTPLGITPDGLVVANAVPETVSPVSTFVNRPPVVSGRKLVLSACRLRYGGQHYQLADLTVLAAADTVESVQNYPLTYIAPVSMPITEFLKVDAAQWLGYSSVTIASVVNQATGLTLTPGVDYAWTENGKLVRINAGATLNVTVNFTGHKERYDLVAYNLNTRALAVRQGVERRITAHEDAYRANAQSGDSPLYMIYVVGDLIKDVIDVSGWRGARNRAFGGEQARIIATNQSRLRRFLTKLYRGDGVIVTGYGDSNTALGGARGTDAAYLPNRAGVDTLAFQGDYYNLYDFEADFRETYMASVGKVTVNGQQRYKTSPNWSVIDKICSGYGYTFAADKLPGSREVVYLNQGIATTTAAATGQNGLNPTRLAAMLNPAGYRTPDLVILAFGMNDRTDAAYVSNIEQIAAAILAAGADVIIVGPHQVNSFSASFTEETWHLVHRRLMECADRIGAAFVPSELFYMGKSRGYLGISDYSLTRTNFANHPGPYEYRKLGEAIANSFL